MKNTTKRSVCERSKKHSDAVLKLPEFCTAPAGCPKIKELCVICGFNKEGHAAPYRTEEWMATFEVEHPDSMLLKEMPKLIDTFIKLHEAGLGAMGECFGNYLMDLMFWDGDRRKRKA